MATYITENKRRYVSDKEKPLQRGRNIQVQHIETI